MAQKATVNQTILNVRYHGDGEAAEKALLGSGLMETGSEDPSRPYDTAATSRQFNGVALSIRVTVTYIGLYLGLVLLVTGMSILALQQMSEAADNRDRYAALSKIGASDKLMSRAVFAQVSIYFAAPIGLALVYSLVGGKAVLDTIRRVGEVDVTTEYGTATVILARRLRRATSSRHSSPHGAWRLRSTGALRTEPGGGVPALQIRAAPRFCARAFVGVRAVSLTRALGASNPNRWLRCIGGRDTLLGATHKGGSRSGEDGSTMSASVGVATTKSAREPVLTIRSGPQSGERFLIHSGRLTIGRDPGSDFCLNDVTVSRLHGVLSRDTGVVSIKDAGSANGTIVNGVLVDERVLGDGDVIRIGDSQLVYSESRKHRRPPIGGTQVTASAKTRRTPRHRLRTRVRSVLAIVVVIAAFLGYQYLGPTLSAYERPEYRANAQSGASTGEAGGALVSQRARLGHRVPASRHRESRPSPHQGPPQSRRRCRR